MFNFLINAMSSLVLMTANMGANTMSTFFSFEPKMPDCLVKSE